MKLIISPVNYFCDKHTHSNLKEKSENECENIASGHVDKEEYDQTSYQGSLITVFAISQEILVYEI